MESSTSTAGGNRDAHHANGDNQQHKEEFWQYYEDDVSTKRELTGLVSTRMATSAMEALPVH